MDQHAGLALAVVALLLAKHFLFDFVFQTRFQLANKHIYGHPGGLAHAALHVLGTSAVFLIARPSWPVGAAILAVEFLAHYHIDWTKELILRRTQWGYADGRYWAVFGGDQLIHGLGYVAIAWVLTVGGWPW